MLHWFHLSNLPWSLNRLVLVPLTGGISPVFPLDARTTCNYLNRTVQGSPFFQKMGDPCEKWETSCEKWETHPGHNPRHPRTPTLPPIVDRMTDACENITFSLTMVGNKQKTESSRYRSGTVNSKSFVGKVLLWIKRKFKLNYTL